MEHATLSWFQYRYFPYERELARREILELLRTSPRQIDGHLCLRLKDKQSAEMLRRLTYFQEAHLSDGTTILSDQAKLEASSRVLEGPLSLSNSLAPSGHRRQATRYSAHGLHEYKGKFNPQVVRAIGNILGIHSGEWVLDPFCGSGTSLLESAHIGWNCIGLDLNPLAVLISNAKIVALRTLPERLHDAGRRLIVALGAHQSRLAYDSEWDEEQIRRFAGPNWEAHLPNFDYLARWFPRSVLAQLSAILQTVDQEVHKSLKPIFRVILSDLVRSVSHQDPGDLRIRRRKDPRSNYPLIALFTEAIHEKVTPILAAREVLGRPQGIQRAFVADGRTPLHWISSLFGGRGPKRIDAVITSPPYVSALPYIDTQRLSLALLGLVKPKDMMLTERKLVGAREISQAERKNLERALSHEKGNLPRSIIELCEHLLQLKGNGDGFRRRNVPALVYRYFLEMKQVLENIHAVTTRRAPLTLLVGRNRSVLAGHPVTIDTPKFLADLAEESRWDVVDLIELDTYYRFDVHARNSIGSEALLLLKHR